MIILTILLGILVGILDAETRESIMTEYDNPSRKCKGLGLALIKRILKHIGRQLFIDIDEYTFPEAGAVPTECLRLAPHESASK